MRLNYCLTILHVSILAALFLTLDADSTDSTCDIEIRVRRGTVYEAVLGEDLRIICSVAFCNNSPLTVSWYKYETTKRVPVDVSSSSHIKTEWTHLKPLEGISYLIFQKILRNDSGQYQCHTGGSMSHNINVSVYGEVKLTTVTWTTLEPESTEETFWPNVYRVVGIMAFVITVLTVWVASSCGCKGESRDTPDLSCQPSHDALITTTIYENV